MSSVGLVVIAMTFAAMARAEQSVPTARFVAAKQPSPLATRRVVLTAEVFDALGRVADTLKRETVRYLIGAERGESIIIDLAWRPRIESSTRHNDPRPTPLAPAYACYLSETDIREALLPQPMQIVQVNSEVMSSVRSFRLGETAGDNSDSCAKY